MTTSTPTMDRSWLIQRLEKPRGKGLLGVDNPFSFGGGLRNGGLSDEAMGLLRGVFSFDYMGAAEFEFGAVPKALQSIASDATHLAGRVIEIPLSAVAPHWKERKAPAPDGHGTVFLLARETQLDEVEQRVRGFAKDGYTASLKEATRLDSALRPQNEWDQNVCGWLELDNGFFFFADRDMWLQTSALFGVEVRGA